MSAPARADMPPPAWHQQRVSGPYGFAVRDPSTPRTSTGLRRRSAEALTKATKRRPSRVRNDLRSAPPVGTGCTGENPGFGENVNETGSKIFFKRGWIRIHDFPAGKVHTGRESWRVLTRSERQAPRQSEQGFETSGDSLSFLPQWASIAASARAEAMNMVPPPLMSVDELQSAAGVLTPRDCLPGRCLRDCLFSSELLHFSYFVARLHGSLA